VGGCEGQVDGWVVSSLSMRVCVCVHGHVYVHVYVCTHVFVHIDVLVDDCKQIHTFECICVYRDTCLYVHMSLLG